MSSTTLFRFSSIVLLLGAVISAVNEIVLTLVFPNSGPGLPMSAPTNALWGPLWMTGFIATLLVLFGLPGLYLRQASRAGIVGFIGIVFTMLGLLLSMIAAPIFFITTLPYLATHAPAVFNNAFDAGIEPFGLVGGVLLLLGLLLLGIATIRAAVFPRLAGILILVGGLFTPALILGDTLIVSLLGAVGLALAMVGFAWIGLRLTSSAEMKSVQVSRPLTETVR
jgi:hypothetical protein